VTEGWKPVSIGDFCKTDEIQLQTGPFGSQLHSYDYVTEGVAVVPTVAISNGRIDHSALPRIAPDKALALGRHKLELNDILFARRGAQATGKTARVRPEERGFICGTGAIRLRVTAGSKRIFAPFLAALLGDKSSIDWLMFHAIGATMPNLNEGIIKSFQFVLPPLPEQRAIAATLSALDDKIEVNRQMNETLEAMARALFRDWFVDFGPTRAKMTGIAPYLSPDLWSLFPDSLDDAGKPEGWEFSTIGSLTHRVTKGTTPTKQQVTAALDEAWINFLRVNNLSEDGKLLLGNTVKVAQSVHEGALRRSILQQDDLLYSIAGTIGRVAKTPKDVLPANVNQAIAIVRPNPELASPNYLLLWLSDEGFQNDLHSNIVQAVQANLSLGMLSDARILVPPREIHTTLLRPIDALLERKAHNERESRTLAQTRNLLLPRLMSGELRVAEAERTVEAVL